MTVKSVLNNYMQNRWSKPLLTVLLLLALLSPLGAAEAYLKPGQPDGIALLPAPPAPDSPEQAADLASARRIFKHRTAAEEARATRDVNLSLFNFAPAIGSFFKPGEFPKTEALFDEVKKEIGGIIDAPKNHWKRARPYETDRRLSLGEPEPSRSYPSGHSTRGTLQALMLAELFPERRERILQTGRNIGWDRILIGKHYPTDVFAGRVLGQAIFHELMKSPEFQHDLSEAKAEVQAPQRVVTENKELVPH